MFSLRLTQSSLSGDPFKVVFSRRASSRLVHGNSGPLASNVYPPERPDTGEASSNDMIEPVSVQAVS